MTSDLAARRLPGPGRARRALGAGRDNAAFALLAHLATEAQVDPHLAEPLAIVLALAADGAGGAASRYRTSQVTERLRTHAELLTALWPVTVTVDGGWVEVGEVTITPQERGPRAE